MSDEERGKGQAAGEAWPSERVRRVIRVLYRGGVGAVWIARLLRLPRSVVLRVVLGRLAS